MKRRDVFDIVSCYQCRRPVFPAEVPGGRVVLFSAVPDPAGTHVLVRVVRSLPRMAPVSSSSSGARFVPHWPTCRRLDAAERTYAAEMLSRSA